MQLRFDFQQQTRRFSQPVKIITTHQLDEVLDKLKQVEAAVAQGFYAAGYIAYEAAPAFHPYYQTAPQGEMPLICFGIFSAMDQTPVEPEPLPLFPDCHWLPVTCYNQYQSAIARIRSEIAAGNTYQVNYTVRLKSNFTADSYGFYLYLLNAQQAQYAAYLDLGRYQVLSASPELFFHWQQQTLTTKPMKGTADRGTTLAQDKIQQQTLRDSLKNQAENVMIVDLLRNDLSQVAKPGSVKVKTLFEVEKYPTVWQMTSTITAQTPANTTLTDVFKALFPCGSITGAPKASTMRLIAELEPTPREVYCGAIGFITPDNQALFSVPIRTVLIDSQQQTMSYGVGGGITWDSTAEDEYQETVNKAQILHGVKLPQQLLETVLLRQGHYVLLERHLTRLSQSADYFDFICPIEQIHSQLTQLAARNAQGEWKIRLLLAQNGELTLESIPFSAHNHTLQANWSPFAVNSQNRLLYHKTTERSHYPAVDLDREYLLYNERDEITEFVNGNVALWIEGKWLTPPVSCGLLPGTQRQQLLAEGVLSEAVISRQQLAQAEKIAFINSVRGWCNVIWHDSQ